MITSKTQLQSDITASTFTAPQKVILDNIVDSYEDIFAQLTTVQRNALTPSAGLIIYNTDTNVYEYYNGVNWSSWSGLNTPMTIKVDWSTAEIKQSHSIAKMLLPNAGAGFAYAVSGIAWRYTYGSTPFNFSDVLYLIFSTKTGADSFFNIDLSGSSSTSGFTNAISDPARNIIVENDNITLKADANATTGDGVLSIWLTYSLIAW